MPITYMPAEGLIHISAADVSYIIHIYRGCYPLHVYYGKRVPEEDVRWYVEAPYRRKKLIENLSNNVSRAYIGIRGQDVTEELSDKTGIPKGVLISRVADDSPAMMAGMKEYDVIVKLGEHKVETIKQYHEQLGKYSTGDVVTVTAMRKGAEGYAEMTFDVTMGEV